MNSTVSPVSVYLRFYEYLPVLDAEQIRKLRKIAIGILDVSAFSDEEIRILKEKLQQMDQFGK